MGHVLMPNTVTGTTRKQHRLPGGFRNILVHNIKELAALLTGNRFHCADCSHVSPKTHKATGGGAAQLPAGTNPRARLCAHCMCVHKTTKFCLKRSKKIERQPTGRGGGVEGIAITYLIKDCIWNIRRTLQTQKQKNN